MEREKLARSEGVRSPSWRRKAAAVGREVKWSEQETENTLKRKSQVARSWNFHNLLPTLPVQPRSLSLLYSQTNAHDDESQMPINISIFFSILCEMRTLFALHLHRTIGKSIISSAGQATRLKISHRRSMTGVSIAMTKIFSFEHSKYSHSLNDEGDAALVTGKARQRTNTRILTSLYTRPQPTLPSQP